MPRLDVRITTPDREALRALAGRDGVAVLETTTRRVDGGYAVRAVVASEDVVAALTEAGYAVEVLADADEAEARALAQVGRGNRFLRRG